MALVAVPLPAEAHLESNSSSDLVHTTVLTTAQCPPATAFCSVPEGVLSQFGLLMKRFGFDYDGASWILPTVATVSAVVQMNTPLPSPQPLVIENTPVPATPLPIQTVKPIPLGPAELGPLFQKYSQEYGVSQETLVHIARCESGFNSGAMGAGIYGGMFQFLASTWSSNRSAMGLDPNPDLRFNAEEAIRTAAFKISRDGTGAWANCAPKI